VNREKQRSSPGRTVVAIATKIEARFMCSNELVAGAVIVKTVPIVTRIAIAVWRIIAIVVVVPWIPSELRHG